MCFHERFFDSAERFEQIERRIIRIEETFEHFRVVRELGKDCKVLSKSFKTMVVYSLALWPRKRPTAFYRKVDDGNRYRLHVPQSENCEGICEQNLWRAFGLCDQGTRNLLTANKLAKRTSIKDLLCSSRLNRECAVKFQRSCQAVDY